MRGSVLALDIVQIALLCWFLLGILGLFFMKWVQGVTRWLFPAGAVAGLLLAVAAGYELGAGAACSHWNLGIPGLSWQVRLDPLSAWFLLVLGSVSAAISLFAAAYFRHREATPAGLICFHYHNFLIGMSLVVLASNAYLFMLAWESMAVSSYLLVTSNHKLKEIRDAGLLYLVMAQAGGLLLLVAFLSLHTPGLEDGLGHSGVGPIGLSGVVMLAIAGLFAKMGLVPFHVWLPEAHPAAPSPVSALMSGLMLKTALYALLRWTLIWLPALPSWCGVLILGMGLLTALYGVIHAAVQVDMKRLLAYSSMENMGLLCVALGLALIFRSYGMMQLSAMALAAVLYHTFSHALFKSLLFLATGSVLHATGERNLGHLGGLMRRMPWTAWLALVGVLSAAGLPLFAGFVAEWLILQAFLFTPNLPQDLLNLLIPVLSAVIALVTALSAYTMVKFYGIVFLGQPREPGLLDARDAGSRERWGMGLLALGCMILGLLPTYLLPLALHVAHHLLNLPDLATAAQHGWLLAPMGLARASYSPLVFLLVLALGWGLVFMLVRLFQHGKSRRSAAWDCGYPWQTSRMQDTAEGFGQPIRQIFSPFMRMIIQFPSVTDRQPHYDVAVHDRIWERCYLPLIAGLERISHETRHLQGSIALSLGISFVTLVVLLVVVVS
ncbi:MAG: hydrogenase 4 subunit B [Pseudomonadales bacterium]|nr:hydrogenase 4 subunit B [Pseudomonadales bacterium]